MEEINKRRSVKFETNEDEESELRMTTTKLFK